MLVKTALALNNLIQEVFDLADGHVMLNSRFYGDFLDIYQSDKVTYSTLLMNVSNATVDESYYHLTIELMVMDKVFKDASNMTDVESDTLTILGDVFSVMTYSNRWQAFSKLFGQSQMRKFIQKGEDSVTGWAMTIELGLKRNNGICDIPMKDYDFEGEYTPSCVGVRIFEDEILIEVVESGGRFDYSTGGGDCTVENSDQSYQQTVTAGDTLVLPDNNYEVFLDGVSQGVVSGPSIKDQVININWT